jgi:hypothetical protein
MEQPEQREHKRNKPKLKVKMQADIAANDHPFPALYHFCQINEGE